MEQREKIKEEEEEGDRAGVGTVMAESRFYLITFRSNASKCDRKL